MKGLQRGKIYTRGPEGPKALISSNWLKLIKSNYTYFVLPYMEVVGNKVICLNNLVNQLSDF